MVEPGTLETCNTEKPFKAVKLVRTRVQRIPSRSRAAAQSKTGYICADPTVIFAFRLRQRGGPYIPYCRRPCKSVVKGRRRCSGRARESAQCVMPGFVVRTYASRQGFLLFAEPDIHLPSRAPRSRHRRLSWCSLPVPKQFEESLGSVSSFAQSAIGRTWQSAHR